LSTAAKWICPTEFDRARLMENEAPARFMGILTAIAVAITLICAIPTLGWRPIGVVALAGLSFAFERLQAERAYPELLLAGTALYNVLLTCIVVAVTGGARSLLLPWLVLPILANAPRFRPQVLLGFTAFLAVALAGTLLLLGDRRSFTHPLPLLVLSALFVSVTAGTYVLTKAEVTQRTAAVLDALTGLLNRKTLDARAQELAAQAELTGEALSCLVVDIDFFKRINDEHGHEQGDLVLRQVAYELRKELGSFEALYRIGGEEFLALLPGRDLATAEQIGQRIRGAASRISVGPEQITLSVGVAVAGGARIDFADLFRRADAAMYSAKRHGRNRVWLDRSSTRIVAPRTELDPTQATLPNGGRSLVD
jgi:diguanylate cyclase (GGDEF)-like protein